MSLSHLKIPKQKVELSDGNEVEVRGLSFSDVVSLYNKHSKDIEKVFGNFTNDSKKRKKDSRNIISEAMLHCPELCASAVALAADDPKNADKILQLGMMDQVNLAIAVGEMTFRSDEDVSRVVGVLVKGLDHVSNALSQVDLPSLNSLVDTETGSANSVQTGIKNPELYTLGQVIDENAPIVRRENARMATEATLQLQVVSCILGGKKAFKAFQDSINALTGD